MYLAYCSTSFQRGQGESGLFHGIPIFRDGLFCKNLILGVDNLAEPWYHITCRQATWCHGSGGRAHRSHRWGRRFESYWHHQIKESPLVGGSFICLFMYDTTCDTLRCERTSMGHRSLAPPVAEAARRRCWLTERSETVGSSPTGTTTTSLNGLVFLCHPQDWNRKVPVCFVISHTVCFDANKPGNTNTSAPYIKTEDISRRSFSESSRG